MVGFIIALFIIVGMLITAVLIMNIGTSNKVTGWNFAGLRVGFSMYAGWLTAATILNTCMSLRTAGFNEAEMSGLDESVHAVIILITAEVIYMLAGFSYRNPIMSSIYIYVLTAIRAKQ